MMDEMEVEELRVKIELARAKGYAREYFNGMIDAIFIILEEESAEDYDL